MTEIKNISNMLEYFLNNYKDEYAIATSLIIYLDTSKKSAIEKEMVKRINIFKNENENINNKLKKTFEILEEIKVKLSLKYGENDEILYDEDKFSLNYKFISDFCKGCSMINSIHSKEYIDMYGGRYKTKLSQLLTKINNKLNKKFIEEKNKNLDGIVSTETDYIKAMNINKTNTGKKLLNYHASVKRDREECIDKMKKQKEIKQKEIKIANEKNEVIGSAIGLFMLYNNTIYEIKNEDYNYIATKIKESFKTNYNDNINEFVNKIEDIAIDNLNENKNNYKFGTKKWVNVLNYEEDTIIRKVAIVKIKLNKDLSDNKAISNLITEMREINSHFINRMDSARVKEIVEEEIDKKFKIEEKIENKIKVDFKENKEIKLEKEDVDLITKFKRGMKKLLNF